MQRFDDGSGFPYDEYKAKKPAGTLAQSSGSLISPNKSIRKDKDSAVKKLTPHSETKRAGMGSATKETIHPKNKTMQVPQHSFEESAAAENFGRYPLNQIPDMGSPIFAQRITQTMARLKDLCPEDKSKIGELIKKLAAEKEEKEKLQNQVVSTKESYEKKIETLMQQQQRLLKESEEVKTQYNNSIGIIKSLQASAEKQKPLQSSSAFNTKENLQKSSPQSEKFILKPPAKDPKQANRGLFSNLTESFKQQKNKQISESNSQSEAEEPSKQSEKASENLKPVSDISRLKNEIEELTLSIRSLSISPNKAQGNTEKNKSQALFSSLGNKNSSPVKLVEDYIPSVDKEDQRPTKDVNTKTGGQKKQLASKPPILHKDSSSGNIKKNMPIVNSSSEEEEDEVEIANKWLNLRKEKIKQVNESIVKEKENAENNIKQKSKHKQPFHALMKLEAQGPSPHTEPKKENNTEHVSKVNRPLPPSNQKFETAAVEEEEEEEIYPQKLKNAPAELPPSHKNIKTQTPQKKLVIDLDTIDENKIHELHDLLNSKLSQLSGRKKSPNNNQMFSLSASKGSKSVQELNPGSVKGPAVIPNVYREDLFDQPLAHSGSKRVDTIPQDSLQKSQPAMKEELEMNDLESDPNSSQIEANYPEKPMINSINNSDIFPEKAADKKLAEIDRLYEEKLKEYLRIRDQMLGSLSTTNDQIQTKAVVPQPKESNKPININNPPNKKIAVPSAKEYEDRVFASSRSQDSRTTANFLNNPVQMETSERPNRLNERVLDTNREELLFSEDKWNDTKPQESTTRTFQRSGDVRTLAKQFARTDYESDLFHIDDFYDDQLFNTVNEIEKAGTDGLVKQNTRQEPLRITSLQQNAILSQPMKKKVDEEFAELFNTVRSITGENTGKKLTSMLSTNKREQNTLNLSNKDVSDWTHSKFAFEDEDETTSAFNSELPTNRKDESLIRERIKSGTVNNSYVESDTSLLMIKQRLNEMSAKTRGSKRNRDKFL